MKARVPLLRNIFDAQAGRCFYCKKPLIFKSKSSRKRSDGKLSSTKDHFIPKAEGGARGRTNIVCACSPCNNLKGQRLPTEKEKVKFKKVYEKAIQLHGRYLEKMRKRREKFKERKRRRKRRKSRKHRK